MSTTKYLEPAEKGKDLPNMQGSENEALPESQVPSQKSKSTHTKDTKGNAAEIAIKNIKEPLAQLEQTVQELPPSTTIPPALFALSSFPPDELIALITSGVRRAEKIRELCELLRTLVCMGEYQLGSDDHRQFMESLDVICGGKVESTTKLNTPKAPIEFKDAVGRKFSFPWHLCKTWKVCCRLS